MTQTAKDQGQEKKGRGERAKAQRIKRSSEALKANLQRRKRQARGRGPEDEASQKEGSS